MLSAAENASDEGPVTLERIIYPGEPTILVRELTGAEAASMALLELAATDEDDDPITLERTVPKYTHADFDASLIDALEALEQDDDTPEIEAEVISFRDLRMMERLLEPYVDFRSLAAL